MPKPNMPAPSLDVPLVGEETMWRLSEQAPESFTLIVFYRGLHCPICKRQLQELSAKIESFRAEAVEVIAVSGDGQQRAERAHGEWELGPLTLGYGQSVESMREWGLFISKGIKEGEPELFGEPGLFLIRPDGSIYFEAVQSMPFARPPLNDLLSAIGFVRKNGYPARGFAQLASIKSLLPRTTSISSFSSRRRAPRPPPVATRR
jgi:peroxiredoxin